MNFKGSDSPDVYVLDFHNEENPLEEYPMSGQRGSFILSLLGSFSLLDRTRFANISVQGKDIVEDDIIQRSPKVIVGFGSEAVSMYLDTKKRISDISGQIFDIEIKGIPFKFLVMLSPGYILKRMEDSSLTLKYSQDLYKAFQVVQGDFRDILSEKEILSAHSFDEFLEIYETRFKDDPEIAYDIETNARPPMFKGSRIIGFSIGNKKSGVYTSIDSLDFHMSKDEEDQIWDLMINEVFEKKSKLIIHNTMYERPYTLYCKNYEIKFEKAHDTLVMARLLRSPKEGAGLKYQAQKYLQYPDWETDLSNYIGGVLSAINRIGLGPKKYSGIYSEMTSGTSIFEIQEIESGAYSALSDSDKEEIDSIIGQLKSPILDLYDEEGVLEIGKLITEKIIEATDQGGVQDSTIPYNWIPDKLLSKYGAVDSLATFDLKDYFFNIMDRESTDMVDLHKGYQNWLEHMYVAYIMERNGMYWNEGLASKDREYLSEQATRCLRDMLLSPVFEPCIEEVAGWRYKPIILSDYLPQIAVSQGFEVNYDRLTEKYVLKHNGKRVQKGRISEILIPQSYSTQYSEILKNLFYEEVKGAQSYEELKDIYNPSSSTESHIAFKCLITPELQYCHKILSLATLAKSPEFEGEVTENLPAVDKKLLSVAKLLEDEDQLKSLYGENWAESRKQIYQGFLSLLATHGSKVRTPEIQDAISPNNKFFVEALDDPGVISLYNCLKVTGIDKDDPSTYTAQFKWMIDYRLFKKSMKLISSYIDGSVGRGSVAIVDENELVSGAHRLERKSKYYERPLEGKEAYVLNTKWSPNTAETGRWRSAIHTIPYGSQVKKYYTSRFPGGTMLMPDYSQMEVRSLAAVSHDENMLELFRSGRDFHTETAKAIFQKDEVTPGERRFSKTATFSLLYGAMESSFAQNYCNGNMSMANKIYQGFFRAYPQVQEWIRARHEEVARDHRVSLDLSNRFIKIEVDSNNRGAEAAMKRKAQNYPIQATSADLTGCVVYDIQKFIEDNNLRALIVMYVHDSIEIDLPPFELIHFVSELKKILINSPLERMGLPSQADVALGYSLGHEIDMKDIETNEDYTECTMTLKGYWDEIEETVENWRTAYASVEVFDEDFEEIYVSMSELFILRKAYTPTIGTHRKKGTCKVHIKYYA